MAAGGRVQPTKRARPGAPGVTQGGQQATPTNDIAGRGSIQPSIEDNRSIERRINEVFDDLTESERRLARVVRQAGNNLPSFAAHELAARAEVSKATAARFFQRLGYATYGEARRQSRDQPSWASPMAELAGEARPTQASGFAAHAAHDCRNLTQTAQAIPEEAIQAAIGILTTAATVHVVGFRNSMALASYARSLLSQVRPRVALLPMAGMTMAEELAGFEPGDALLAIGFRRRPRLLRKVLNAASQDGLPIVLVADDSAAAASQLASVTLRCEHIGRSLFDSYAAAISLINYLGSSVGHATGEAAVKRLGRIEDLHAQLGSLDAERYLRQIP